MLYHLFPDDRSRPYTMFDSLLITIIRRYTKIIEQSPRVIELRIFF
jgi:hypothetical protein